MSCSSPPSCERVSNPTSLANKKASLLSPCTILFARTLLSVEVFCLPCEEADFGVAAAFGEAADLGDGAC